MRKVTGILIIFVMFVITPSVVFYFFLGVPWYGWIAALAGVIGLLLVLSVVYKITLFSVGLILGDK